MVEGNKETGLMKGNLAQRRIEMQVKLDAARESGKADEVEKAEAAMAALVGKIGTAKQIDHKVNPNPNPNQVAAIFELERVLAPSRPPSTMVAVNRRACC